MAVLPISLLVGAAVAGPVLAYAASIKSDNMFALLFRFGVIPMTLFAGVFFPVEAMPTVARWLAYVSPLWHGVELCRAATLGWPPPFRCRSTSVTSGCGRSPGYAAGAGRGSRRS